MIFQFYYVNPTVFILLHHPHLDAENVHRKTYLGHKPPDFLKLNFVIKRVIRYYEKCKEINGETENILRGKPISHLIIIFIWLR